jgi:hypothetical protein
VQNVYWEKAADCIRGKEGCRLHPAQESRPEKSLEIHRGNSSGIIGGPRVISYNLSEGERPGGMKVRFKVRIETGKKAAALNAQQAAAIKELLQWAHQHKPK